MMEQKKKKIERDELKNKAAQQWQQERRQLQQQKAPICGDIGRGGVLVVGMTALEPANRSPYSIQNRRCEVH